MFDVTHGIGLQSVSVSLDENTNILVLNTIQSFTNIHAGEGQLMQM